MTFGSGVRRRLNDSYKEAKERFGIVTSLPMQEGKPRGGPDQEETDHQRTGDDDQDDWQRVHDLGGGTHVA